MLRRKFNILYGLRYFSKQAVLCILSKNGYNASKMTNIYLLKGSLKGE